MTNISKRLRWLRGVSASARNQALIDALGHAATDEIAPLAGALLERPNQGSYRVLIRRFHELPQGLREVLRQADGRISPVLSDSLVSGTRVERENALALIGTRRDLKCLGALGRLIDTQQSEWAERAAAILLNTVRYHIASGRRLALTQLELKQIDDVLAETIDRFPDHRQPAVLLAAALMSRRPGPRLAAWLADADHPSHFAARGVLKKFQDEALAEHLLDWLSIETLAPQVLPRLARVATTEHLGSVLKRDHLLCLPEVTRRLHRLDSRRPALPDAASTLAHLSPEQQRALPRWIGSIPMRAADRVERLSVGLSFADAWARLVALQGLIDLDSVASDGAVLSFCFDPDESVARLATRHVVRRRPPGAAETLRRLHLSNHASVQALAADFTPNLEFEDLWTRWSIAGMSPTPQDRSRAREFASVHPDRFQQAIRRRLQADSRDTILVAIRLARDADALAPLELDLLAMLGHPDERVAATVVSTLGHLPSPTAREGLLKALSHPAPRVRANALDASRPRMTADDLPHLLTFTHSDENRVRANAIRTVMRFDRPRAASLLEEMLADSRPMHRISALWTVDRARSIECARRVADLAGNDPAVSIRNRAQRTARNLLASMGTRPARGPNPDPVTRSATQQQVN